MKHLIFNTCAFVSRFALLFSNYRECNANCKELSQKESELLDILDIQEKEWTTTSLLPVSVGKNNILIPDTDFHFEATITLSNEEVVKFNQHGIIKTMKVRKYPLYHPHKTKEHSSVHYEPRQKGFGYEVVE